MNSRERIFQSLRKNKVPEKAYPEIALFASSDDPVEAFRSSLLAQGGALIENDSPGEIMAGLFPEMSRWLDVTAGFTPPDFPIEQLQVAFFTAEMGVAENGAVWISEPALGRRELPFIAEHVVFYLERGHIVGNMHQAYSRLTHLSGYGLFISGPSKTADIEQSLVIGAHGPKSHTVVLI